MRLAGITLLWHPKRLQERYVLLSKHQSLQRANSVLQISTGMENTALKVGHANVEEATQQMLSTFHLLKARHLSHPLRRYGAMNLALVMLLLWIN